jgi:hypothetical protein
VSSRKTKILCKDGNEWGSEEPCFDKQVFEEDILSSVGTRNELHFQNLGLQGGTFKSRNGLYV